MSDFVCFFASLISSIIKTCANNTGSFLKDSKIRKRSHAYKSYPSTYSVKILDSLNPELQLKDIESSIKNELIDLLSILRRFKFVTMSVLEFKKQKMMNIYSIFYSNSKAETIINENDIDGVFESIYITTTSSIQKSQGQCSD